MRSTTAQPAIVTCNIYRHWTGSLNDAHSEEISNVESRSKALNVTEGYSLISYIAVRRDDKVHIYHSGHILGSQSFEAELPSPRYSRKRNDAIIVAMYGSLIHGINLLYAVCIPHNPRALINCGKGLTQRMDIATEPRDSSPANLVSHRIPQECAVETWIRMRYYFPVERLVPGSPYEEAGSSGSGSIG